MLSSYVFSIILAVISTLIQSSPIANLLPLQAIPELSYVVLIYYAYMRGSFHGQIIGFLIGFILDAASGLPFGFSMITYTVAGFSIGKFKGTVALDPIFTPMLLIFLCYLFKSLLVLLISLIFPIETLRDQMFSFFYLLTWGLTIIIGPLWFALMRLIENFFPYRGYESGSRANGIRR